MRNIDWNIVHEYIKVLAWPIVVTSFLVYFRKNISELIKGIWKIKYPGGEITTREPNQIEVKNVSENNTDKLLDLVGKYHKVRYEGLKKITDQEKMKLEMKLLVKDFELQYEKIYSIIYGSQIRLLESIKSSSTGVSQLYIDQYFLNIKNGYPAQFSTWNSDHYINFLIGSNLLTINSSGNYVITETTNAFIDYINRMGYQKNKGL